MAEAMPIMIYGDTVYLRALEFTDLAQLLTWRNKPEFRRYFRETRELNWEQQKAWFFSKCVNDPQTRMFAIVRHEDNKLLGACGLCYIDWVNGSADFSIYIGHDDHYLDDQYAPAAAELLKSHAFLDLRLHRLWAEVYSFDKKKQAFFEKIGFKVDGVHPQTTWHGGVWHDSVYFSLISDKEQ